jgi:hypothetical protein
VAVLDGDDPILDDGEHGELEARLRIGGGQRLVSPGAEPPQELAALEVPDQRGVGGVDGDEVLVVGRDVEGADLGLERDEARLEGDGVGAGLDAGLGAGRGLRSEGGGQVDDVEAEGAGDDEPAAARREPGDPEVAGAIDGEIGRASCRERVS